VAKESGPFTDVFLRFSVGQRFQTLDMRHHSLSRYEDIDQDSKYREAWEKYLRSERYRKADIHTDDKRPTVQDNKSAYLSES
jgi:hypothetical protein